jgi:hypothetical protein
MDTDQRVEVLEQELKRLKSEIQVTLAAIQQNLPEPAPPPARWHKRAWSLALLNMLLAVALFTNIYFYLPGAAPFDIDPTLAGWLRAFWIAMAFIWLLLQLYPLALLLEQEDRQPQGVVWRNITSLVRTRPSFIVLLTLAVLIVSIINLVVPVVWLIVALILLIGVGGVALGQLFALRRAHAQTPGKH